jgi:hypothetical protein
VADKDLVAVLEVRADRGLSIYKRAVGAAAIDQDELTVLDVNPAMACGDQWVVETNTVS